MENNKTKLAKEARKFKSVDDFIQSVRLNAILRDDLNRLAEVKKNPSYVKFLRGGDTKILKKEIADVKKELKKLPENKLWNKTVDLLNEIDTTEKGWFEKAENFYKKEVN